MESWGHPDPGPRIQPGQGTGKGLATLLRGLWILRLHPGLLQEEFQHPGADPRKGEGAERLGEEPACWMPPERWWEMGDEVPGEFWRVLELEMHPGQVESFPHGPHPQGMCPGVTPSVPHGSPGTHQLDALREGVVLPVLLREALQDLSLSIPAPCRDKARSEGSRDPPPAGNAGLEHRECCSSSWMGQHRETDPSHSPSSTAHSNRSQGIPEQTDPRAFSGGGNGSGAAALVPLQAELPPL